MEENRSVSVKCPYCGKYAELVNGEVIYPHREDLYDKHFYLCEPCDAYVGTHDNPGKLYPFGTLANAKLREARSLAHKAFNPIWQDGYMTQSEAYKLLAKELRMYRKDCHISKFGVRTCRKVVRVSQEILRTLEIKSQ